ncbi:MAG: hypothetical protein ACLRJV_08735 [Eubacteriales bacterium]
MERTEICSSRIETVIDMYPLDFEEFLWANGIADPVIDMLKK